VVRPAGGNVERARHLVVALAGIVTLVAAPVTASAQVAAGPQMRRAVALFERGDYAAAKVALSSDEGDAVAAYYLGRIAVVEDRLDDAVRAFERAIRADVRRAEYHAWLGIALGLQARDAGRLRQTQLASRAKGEFERAVALDPLSVSAREGLVQFYSVAPGILGGSGRRAREQAAEIARIDPMRGHLANGIIHERERDYFAAEREYAAAAVLAPDSAAPLLAMGGLYQRSGRWARAFAAYERVLALRGLALPELLSARYQFGRTGALSGERLADSERALKQWLAEAPRGTSPRRVARTRARLGMVYAHQGRTALARAEFEAALKLNPRDADARAGLKEQDSG
jgi:tetratricopeptide (TPR) repeat protein